MAPDSIPEDDEEKWQLLTRHEKLGEVLLKHGKITLKQLDEIMQELGDSDRHFGDVVVSKGIMSRSELLEALEWQHKSDKVGLESMIELKEKLKPE
jgi:type IV pilus assembly protein PilB